jgi:branched-chain amino acid transport system substrate-binding protein
VSCGKEEYEHQGDSFMLTRRSAFRAAAGLAAATATGTAPAFAADQVVKVGIDMPYTGADAVAAVQITDGAQLAFDEANRDHEVPGITFQLVKYDDGTATAGQYDPAQAATNARKMVGDPMVLAALGPEMSGSGKAMAPILSMGGLATITPASTNPDITDPRFAAQYRPGGKTIYFRTVATDAYQGPYTANFMAETLKVKAVYVLDDSGAYGVGLADAFQKQAAVKGMKVLGRDRLDPKAADYTSVLTKIKSLGADGLYYGGVTEAGVKLVKQSYDIIPQVSKAAGDGMQSSDLLSGAGFPAVEGWYVTVAAPHLVGDPHVANFLKRFNAEFHMQPEDYSLTCYVAARVIIEAAKELVAKHEKVTRAAMRDAIQNVNLQNTLIGPVSFDANGDLKNKIISVFQIRKDPTKPLNSMEQYAYVGVAPAA